MFNLIQRPPKIDYSITKVEIIMQASKTNKIITFTFIFWEIELNIFGFLSHRATGYLRKEYAPKNIHYIKK